LSEPILKYETKEDEFKGTEINKDKSRISYYKLWWSGAVAASILLCWIFFNMNRSKETIHSQLANNTITTKPGSKTYIKLPDGSKVWLNADSKITYSGDFQGAIREVYLSGEAFFDVAKDKTRPFIIHTKTIDLKVLGTAFNVRSYDNEKETETSLVHGSVEVTLKNNPDKKIILKPSEKLLVKNGGPDSSAHSKTIDKIREEEPLIVLSKMHILAKDSSSIETSWTKNRLAFDKDNLEEIALKIERWYNVQVIITDQSLNEEKYTGLFEDETLEEVMDALQMTGDFHYTIRKKEVIISP
jgi:ferric-dicitrate binding protein FerR (iron transport regulator)